MNKCSLLLRSKIIDNNTMPRPVRHRRMQRPPIIKGFKPYGGQVHSSDKVNLLMEEYESIRLLDFEMHTQLQGAKIMGVSRPTFTRIYESARKKIALAMVLSKELTIGGGNVSLEGSWYRCTKCNAVFELGNEEDIEKISCPHCQSDEFESINDKLNQFDKPQFNYFQDRHSAEAGYCICRNCGMKISHKRGFPCRKVDCPKCGIPLFRESVLRNAEMKIAVSVQSNTDNPLFDPKFGRAAYFALIDKGKVVDIVENRAKESAGGAGPAAVSFVASLGVKRVISGSFGNKAESALEAAGIEADTLKGQELTINEIIKNIILK